jgi:hypothetical protein
MTELKKLKSIDIKLLDEIFEMGGGYVLDFSNSTFSEFFNDELGINIDDAAYEVNGTSKAKKLRFYIRQTNIENVIKVILALWEYREAIRRRSSQEESMANAKAELFLLIKKLGGNPPEDINLQSSQSGFSNLSAETANNLHKKLMNVSALEPHPRGFAFEKFLKELFDANGMDGRASFRVIGEQIDGSFEMTGETYLLEAKWTSKQVDASDLRSFNAKVEDKAAWSRGLFVSDSGFTEDGLLAFGKGKSLVCMDGLDISEMLQRRMTLQEALSKKVRRAAETGKPFVRLRDLV